LPLRQITNTLQSALVFMMSRISEETMLAGMPPPHCNMPRNTSAAKPVCSGLCGSWKSSAEKKVVRLGTPSELRAP